MKIYSRNVAGMNNPGRFHEVINDARRFDFAMLQETKLSTSDLARIKLKWGNPSAGGRRGVVTLVSARLAMTHTFCHSDPNGQFLANVGLIDHQTFLFLNLYGDPDSDAHAAGTMDRVTQVLDDIDNRFSIDSIIIGGDFNFCLTDADRYTSSRKPRAEGKFSTLITAYDLFDAGALAADVPPHTYFRHRNETTSARYDRFHVSANLVPGLEYKILRRTSDHAPISIEVLKHRTGSKQWQFNDELLNSPSFIQKLQENIKNTISQFSTPSFNREDDICELQNHIDYERHSSCHVLTKIIENLRNMAKLETKRLREQNLRIEKDAVNKLIQARVAFNSSNDPSDELVEELESAQLNLKSAQIKRANKASERNYLNYATMGERSTAYHFAISNRGRPSRDIRKLIVNTPAGITTLSNQEIVEHMTRKFAAIASPDPVAGTMSIAEFLGPALTNSSRKCPPEMAAALTRQITQNDIEEIVKGLKKVSAPGPLGITNSLLKFLLPILSSLLVRVGNDILFSNEPQDVARWFFHRIVIFILKPGKPVTDEDSYRGLSMLENIFKLYSKLLASRLAVPLRHIQDKHQFGFTKEKGCLEASRSIIDAIKLARMDNLPLIIISTDFYKAFDSVALDHIENSLKFYDFPQEFVTAFMRLVRSGTVQFEVNGLLSDEHNLDKGTGQGDPKSSGSYNISVAPLNHYLATSPDVPRFEARGMEFGPVLFADDMGTLFKGTEIDRIIATLMKIADFRKVSGHILNLIKCEILAINCNEEDIQRLIAATNMKRVTQLKHLGLLINEQGDLQHDLNIAPVAETMRATAEQYNSSYSSPLGRAIYAKYLLASKYVHRLQNMPLSNDQLSSLRDSVLQMTWTRARPADDTVSHRVHIAQDRIAQPPEFGGLGVTDPLVQAVSLRFIWARKFISSDQGLTWYRILNSWLTQVNRPGILQHLKYGSKEWMDTSFALSDVSDYWAHVFSSIATIIELSHKLDKEWQLIPLIGSEILLDNDRNIGSLRHFNPFARQLVEAGLLNVGQLFGTNELGFVDVNSVKTRIQLQHEFDVNISITLMNSIVGLLRATKQKYRLEMNSRAVRPDTITTIISLTRKFHTGCSVASQLLLHQQRLGWEWGQFPRSFHTYQRDGFNNISAHDFSNAFLKVRSTSLAPSIQWTSTQILLRTIWTRVKEGNSRRRLNDDPNLPYDSSCLNCGREPEHTVHIFYHCSLAVGIWNRIMDSINDIWPPIFSDNTPFPISHSIEAVLFQRLPPSYNRLLANDLTDIIMSTKHILYRLRFRQNVQRFPTLKLATINVALELDKVIGIRHNGCLWAIGLEAMSEKLKSLVGF